MLDYRDHVSELLTTLDACQITLDVTNNFDATRLYLNVVSIYVRLMILLSRVDDRKAVLGLFNAAHEMIHGQCDPSFPRLGQVKTKGTKTLSNKENNRSVGPFGKLFSLSFDRVMVALVTRKNMYTVFNLNS